MAASSSASASRSQAELSLRAVLLALVLSVVMGAANVYLGLKVGMTVSASIPAAVVAMVLFRKVMRNGSILEANQVQTTASAGESLAAGIIFTVPALVLVGAWSGFDYWMTSAIAFTGGLLGILFMIPMRRVFVVQDKSELKFPEGLACASVLKAGASEDSSAGAKTIFYGALLGGAAKFITSFLGLIKGTLEGAFSLSGRAFYLGGDVSPALVAVGAIIGLNVSALIFIGGALGWLIGIPLLKGPEGMPALDSAWMLWSTEIRYVGVGAMIVGGIASLFKVRQGLVEAFQELGLLKKPKYPANRTPRNLGSDIPPWAIILFGTIAAALVGFIDFQLTGNTLITILTTITMISMAFFFTAVASYIVGLVGNSNSPVSGMTITALFFTAGLLFIFGFTGTQGIIATLGVSAIVCCAACTSGDVCNDLKTGHLVGATPFKQQIMQIVGVAAAALVMAPILTLLHENVPGGIGGRELAAPQAQLFASLAEGFFGDGDLKWNMLGIGALVGIAILLIDMRLEKTKSTFRMHLMPVAVGMYLPFGLAIPIFIGGIIHHMITKGKDSEAAEKSSRPAVLFASGAIAGESLMGVGIAILASMGISKLNLGVSSPVMMASTVLMAVTIVWLFYKNAKTAKS